MVYEGIELSEFGEGELLAKDLQSDTRVILGIKDGGGDAWMRYDKDQGRWTKISASIIIAEAKDLIKQLYSHFSIRAHSKEEDASAYDNKAYIYFKSRRVFSAAREVANTSKLSKPLHLQWQEVDSRPGLLNCANCTLDLSGPLVQRLDHSPSHLITKRSPVEFDPSIRESPLWSTFLRQVLVTETGEPDTNLERWVCKLMGYIASGAANEEIVALFYGVGANGKNTFLDTISSVLGNYAQTTDPKKLVLASSSNTDIYMAGLQGARLVYAGEMPSKSKWNEAAMKSLTEKTIIARHMRGMPFVFEISHTACFAANHLPSTTDRTHALWRRLKLVPFLAQFKDSNKDANLAGKLKAEHTAILNWVLSGYELYRKEGLGTCVAGERALGTYKEEQRFGTVAHFVDECCESDAASYVSRDSLYDAYKQWCDLGSHQPESNRHFGQELRSMNFQTRREMRDRVRAQYCFGLKMQSGCTVKRTAFGEFRT